jgi:hypothetical protein
VLALNPQIQDLRRPFDGLPRGFPRFECYRSDKNRKNDEGERKKMVSTHQHKPLPAPTESSPTMNTLVMG